MKVDQETIRETTGHDFTDPDPFTPLGIRIRCDPQKDPDPNRLVPTKNTTSHAATSHLQTTRPPLYDGGGGGVVDYTTVPPQLVVGALDL